MNKRKVRKSKQMEKILHQLGYFESYEEQTPRGRVPFSVDRRLAPKRLLSARQSHEET